MLKPPLSRIVFALFAATPAALAGQTRPEPTGFAGLADTDRLLTASEPVRDQYAAFLATLRPRAFALPPDGVYWAWQSGSENAVRGAGSLNAPARTLLRPAAGMPVRQAR